ncbi:GxxExxY protein [Sphingobacteriaceae bacterium]|nr:GxxExxY protein [Sphingobacteriaceae bacterium]
MIITQKYINEISYEIVGGAIEAHKHVGPGLLESVYHSCLAEELESSGLIVESQVKVPVSYKGKDIGGLLRLDMLVNNLVVVELKAVDVMISLYKAQLLSYLKLAGMPKGLLINFHCENITKHLVPLVTEDFALLPKD